MSETMKLIYDAAAVGLAIGVFVSTATVVFFAVLTIAAIVARKTGFGDE